MVLGSRDRPLRTQGHAAERVVKITLDICATGGSYSSFGVVYFTDLASAAAIASSLEKRPRGTARRSMVSLPDRVARGEQQAALPKNLSLVLTARRASLAIPVT